MQRGSFWGVDCQDFSSNSLKVPCHVYKIRLIGLNLRRCSPIQILISYFLNYILILFSHVRLDLIDGLCLISSVTSYNFFACWSIVSPQPKLQAGGTPLVGCRDSSFSNLRTRQTVATRISLNTKTINQSLKFCELERYRPQDIVGTLLQKSESKR